MALLFLGGFDLLKGNRIRLGDTIGIINPASGDDEKIIKDKISLFNQMGFKTKYSNKLFNKFGFLAGSDQSRAEDFMNMIKDPEVNAILCFRGGYGCIRMLPYLDYDLISKNPKIICGYSDITILLNYLYKKIKLITFHGPMVKSNFDDKYTREYFLSILQYGYKNISISLKPFEEKIKIFNKKNFSGRLIGGNLSLLCSSIGTPYEFDTKNSILLIEEVNEEPYALDRMLTHLILSGKLNKCKGFIIGHLTPIKEDINNNVVSLEQVLLERLNPLNKPLILNVPFGHDYPNITLPIGALACVDFENFSIKLNETVVR